MYKTYFFKFFFLDKIKTKDKIDQLFVYMPEYSLYSMLFYTRVFSDSGYQI